MTSLPTVQLSRLVRRLVKCLKTSAWITFDTIDTWLLFDSFHQENSLHVCPWNVCWLQAAHWQLALYFLHELHRSRVEANTISYNATISACEKNASWQMSLALLEEALDSQLQVTEVSFSAAIGACERAVSLRRIENMITEGSYNRISAGADVNDLTTSTLAYVATNSRVKTCQSSFFESSKSKK